MPQWTDDQWRTWNIASELRLWELAARDDAPRLKSLPALESGTANAQDRSGWTPLHVASMRNSAEAAIALIELRADVSWRSGHLKPTALHLAAWHGHTQVMRALLGCKADVAAENELGEFPIEKARQRGMHEAEMLLLQSGSPDPCPDATLLNVGNAHALTARAVCAARAVESDRVDSMFFDPLAHRLAGKEGMIHGSTYSWILVPRTVLADQVVLEGHRRGVRQVVLLGAGMDSRAYRLGLEDMLFFEVDQQTLFDVKEPLLQGLKAPCSRRIPIVADVTDKEALLSGLEEAGFDSSQPSSWILEGLIPYLTPSMVDNLMSSISIIAPSGSVIFHDAVSTGVQKAGVKVCGAPFLSGSDDYARLWKAHGFRARVVDFGKQVSVDRQLKRVSVKPGQLDPQSVQGQPITLFVWAEKA